MSDLLDKLVDDVISEYPLTSKEQYGIARRVLAIVGQEWRQSLADDPAACERGAHAAAAAIVNQAGEAGVDIPSELPKWLIGLAPRVSKAVLRAAERND